MEKICEGKGMIKFHKYRNYVNKILKNIYLFC